MRRALFAAAVFVILVLPVSIMGAFLAVASGHVGPSDKALEESPADLLPIYMAAASTCQGLDWTVLAAIHKVETNFGRGPVTSSKGAQGPMQFMPATWSAYAVDGDRDGVADVNDVDDAIFSAANLLCASGAGDPARLATALWNYNHSDAYVTQVLMLASSYGDIQLSAGYAAPGALLDHPHITFSGLARADLAAGIVDARVVALVELIAQRHTVYVGVFKTGHSKFVRGTSSVSNHYYGRAVDISIVDGVAVSSSSLAARRLVLEIASLQGELRPSEIGHPFAEYRFHGGFTDGDHGGHLHLGFDL